MVMPENEIFVRRDFFEIADRLQLALADALGEVHRAVGAGLRFDPGLLRGALGLVGERTELRAELLDEEGLVHGPTLFAARAGARFREGRPKRSAARRATRGR